MTLCLTLVRVGKIILNFTNENSAQYYFFPFTDLPFSKINSNCDSRAPIYFMIDQHVQCNVVARDLEMFNIIKNIEETKVISVKTTNTSNSVNVTNEIGIR